MGAHARWARSCFLYMLLATVGSTGMGLGRQRRSTIRKRASGPSDLDYHSRLSPFWRETHDRVPWVGILQLFLCLYGILAMHHITTTTLSPTLFPTKLFFVSLSSGRCVAAYEHQPKRRSEGRTSAGSS